MLRIEIFSERKESLGEGPLWDVKEQRLYWIDSYGPAVHRADAKGGDRRTWKLPEPIGSVALRERGGAVLSLRSGFHFLDFSTGEITRYVTSMAKPPLPRFPGDGALRGSLFAIRDLGIKGVPKPRFGA